MQVSERRQQLDRVLKAAIHQTTEENIREFREKYERYLERFEAACRRYYLQKYGHRCRLDLKLYNEGNATATSVEIVLQFPAGSVVIRLQDEEDEIEVPKEPQPKWLAPARSDSYGMPPIYPSAFMPGNFYTTQAIHELRREQQKWKGPFCNDANNTHIVTYRAEELLHEKTWSLPSIIAYIWPGGSSIDYLIRTKELPKKIEGKLHIRWASI